MSMISFEEQAVHDEKASAEAGVAVFRDVPVVTVTIDANSAWSKPVDRVVHENPAKWPEIEAAFQSWKANQAAPAEGISLQSLPFIRPSELEMLKGIGVHTVEALTAAAAADLQRLPGCIELQKRAAAHMKAGASSGKLTGRVRELEKNLAIAEQDRDDARAEAKRLREQLDNSPAAQGELKA